MKAKLSETMIRAVGMARRADDKLTRYPGGYWCGGELDNWNVGAWIGTKTVEALIKRDVMEYTKWKTPRVRGNSFPIEATITAAYKARHITEANYAEARVALINGPGPR